MTKIGFLFALVFTSLVCLLPAAPAQALAGRTFVSAAGSDSNNCANVATPCRHLAAAYAATAANGEIYVLDPANYGALTITGPVSIEGHGWASIAPVSGSAAIAINANPGDKINIIGVVLDGAAIANTVGIAFSSGGTLTVRDSVIRNFTLEGINAQAGASSRLSVSNTLVSDNGTDGIFIFNGLCTLDNVTMENNTGFGLNANSFGLFSIGVMVRNSTMAYNSGGLAAQGSTTTVWLTRSTITGNASDYEQTSGGALISYADNNIVGNNSSGGTPASIGYK
jgi:hypothetical protein